MSKTKKSYKFLFYVTACLMMFSIFMFFMDCLKWRNEILIKAEIAVPNFFDLIFGRVGSPSVTWHVCPSFVVMFVGQLLISVVLFIVVLLLILKAIKFKTVGKLILISSFLCIGLAVLSFSSSVLIEHCKVTFLNEPVYLKDIFALDLNYGAIIYGSSMALSAVLGITTFILSIKK